MTQHTPGPWRVLDDGAFPGIEAQDLSLVVWGHIYEGAGIRGRTKREALANARLMAAAPELLAALRRLVRALSVPGVDAERANAIEQAEQALAKATEQ